MADDDLYNLSDVPTEAMIEALKSRYDGVVIIIEKDKGDGTTLCFTEYEGGLTLAIGLASRALRILSDEAQKGTSEDDGTDVL